MTSELFRAVVVMIDKDLVWQRVGRKTTLLQKIIKQFLEFYPGQVRVIEEAVANHDEETLHRATHRLRGAAANFEALAVVAAASAMEAGGQTGEWSTVREHFDQLVKNLDQLREDLLAFAAEAAEGVSK